ncbi:uncharacterized protein LOC103789382 [Callithrix jacchus]|uniref:uncharacterized protein LOC103789382 n=1 Tax=Callithrix jacchus TaxID=9483 RepID=UPI00159D156F|nr:uncharacterized protein LOC103789382 [Callithrix jacchus]
MVKAKFINRKFLMEELYQHFLDGDDSPVAQDDPFWDPVEVIHLVSAHIWLQSLAYCMKLEEQAEFLNCDGLEEAVLHICNSTLLPDRTQPNWPGMPNHIQDSPALPGGIEGMRETPSKEAGVVEGALDKTKRAGWVPNNGPSGERPSGLRGLPSHTPSWPVSLASATQHASHAKGPTSFRSQK